MTTKRMNKKAAYDFFDMVSFLIIVVISLSVLFFTVSLDQPRLFPKLNADNFVTLLLYSQDSIFEYNQDIHKSKFGVVDIDKLDRLDDLYYVSYENDFLSAKVTLSSEDETIKQSYYNEKYFKLWDDTNPFNVHYYEYIMPVHYMDKSKNKLVEGKLEIDVFANNLIPLKLT